MLKLILYSGLLRGGMTLFSLLFTIGLLAQLNVSVEGENIACFGLSSGTATVIPTNGTPPYSYSWSNGDEAAAIGNLNAGTYGVTVTDASNATATGSITLTEPSRVTATITSPTECEAPFTIAAEPQGGVTPYRYNWSTGADTRGVSVPAGDYCVTVVDANLCGYVTCTTVEENPPSVTVVDVDAQCFGADDGMITANPAGGRAPYSYAWSNGDMGQTITGLAPGIYRVTLTDARGCTATAATTITEPSQITGNIFGDNSVCPGEADAFIRINPTGGTPPYSYVWSPGGFTSQGIGSLPAGTYRVTVTDANECEMIRSFVIVESADVEVAISGDELLCGAGSTGSLSVSPVSGPVSQYTYRWSTGATTPTVSNLGAGTYTVTATDANGCTGFATTNIRIVDLGVSLSSTSVSCNDGNDGTATATATGGDGPYTYQWSNGFTTATITDLAAGVYRVTVTEANDCKATSQVVVAQPNPLQLAVQVNDITCNGINDGSIDLSVAGGTPGYSYAWSNGAATQDLNNLSAGTYIVTVTDANGCTDVISGTVNEPTGINITPIVTNLACNGDNTGRIALSVDGGSAPFSYQWATGQTTRVITNLSAGSYSVTVTDANECTATRTYTVTEPPVLMVTGVPADANCFNGNDGSIDLSISGGTPAYSYAWSNGRTTQDISNLTAGSYSVTVTDANNCQETASFTVSQPSSVTITAIVSDALCNGENSGSIDATVGGGTQAYSFAWSNGASTEDISSLTAGTYALTVTDANGCTTARSYTVGEATALSATAQVSNVACEGDATGSINLSVSGGTPAYSYRWSNTATTQDIDGLAAGSYIVTITDANNCMLERTFTVGSNSAITVTGTASPANCNDEASGSINISVSGGSGPYAYQWSNGRTTQDINNLAAGTYMVTVVDGNECTAIASYTVTEPDEISLTVTAPNITCGGSATGSVTVFPSGGSAPYSFRWSNGDTGMTISNVAAGIYAVTVTDANGCTDVTSGITLSEIPQLECTTVIDQEALNGNDGQLSINLDGGTAPYTYVWSNNATTPTISNLAAGTYSVTVTDANGCTTTCNRTLRAFSGIGDYVWEDWNVDGQQDPNEPGISDYLVYLKNAAGVIIDSTRTDENGFYSFTGLIPGDYSILFPEAPGSIRTLFNTGNDATDNDADPAMNGMTQVYNLEPGEFNMTVDAGFFAEPNGEITESCNCLNNSTTDLDGQFSEVLEIVANIGQTWTIVSAENIFSVNSPAPPATPISIEVGTVLPEVGLFENSDELAIYQLNLFIVDNLPYEVVISNGAYEVTFRNQCFYPVVRFTETPPDTICRFDPVFNLDGFGLLNNQSLPGEVVFSIGGEIVTSINPMTLPTGANEILARFTPTDPDECVVETRRAVFITDECNAKLGDFVFEDRNLNGLQDPGEPGISGVKVTVNSQDGTYMDMTTTDANGNYCFFVPPGTYKITFEQPDDFTPTTPNAGNDELDSDMNPGTLMTPFYTVGPNEVNLTIDAGFVNPCIQNVSNPGTIASSQELCGPGNVPQPFVEIAPATGGIGQIQYLWMYNTEDAGQDISYWQTLPNSNTPNYAPGAIFETTYFVRCVRRNNCPYIEGNVLTVEVGDDAVAEVSGPSSICVGDDAIFQAVNPGAGARITWNFSGSSVVESSTQSTVTTSWQTFGNFSATLTVTRNGCTSTQVFNVSVVNTPNRCGGNLTANGVVDNLQQRSVIIEWDVPADGTEYAFELERSTDGQTFSRVAEVSTPRFVSGGNMAFFRKGDVSPLAGRTFYRVRMMDAEYGDMLSNVIEMQLAAGSVNLGRIFPNPASNGMIHVEMTEDADADLPASVQLYDVRGNAVGPRQYLRAGTGVINLPTTTISAGLYFLRMNVGDRTETHRVVLN